jgi:hypothetical protein
MTAHTIGMGEQRRAAASRDAGDWLCLAAAPAFAAMALLAGIHGDDAHGMICAAAQHASSLNGMAWMYTLMSAFHLTPWLKLIARKR